MASFDLRCALDRFVDRLAMWVEDRVERSPCGYRSPSPGPLRCFEPLPAVPAGPPPSGRWPIASPSHGEQLLVRVVPGRRGSSGTAILVPPWKIRDLRAVAGWSRLLARSGHDVWLYIPPHHLERAEGGRSGEGFVTPDLDALKRTVEQVVIELRILAAAAAARGPVAMVGLSLGALTAALAVTAPERVDAAVLVAPPELMVSLARTRIGERYRAIAARAGEPLPAPEVMRELLAPLSPASRKPSARRVLIAAGDHDIIVPPEAPLALARAWGVEARTYPRGHLTLLLACRQLRRDVEAFLQRNRPL